jgi:hypothetical protein
MEFHEIHGRTRIAEIGSIRFERVSVSVMHGSPMNGACGGPNIKRQTSNSQRSRRWVHPPRQAGRFERLMFGVWRLTFGRAQRPCNGLRRVTSFDTNHHNTP